jgi:hypothetical protein
VQLCMAARAPIRDVSDLTWPMHVNGESSVAAVPLLQAVTCRSACITVRHWPYAAALLAASSVRSLGAHHGAQPRCVVSRATRHIYILTVQSTALQIILADSFHVAALQVLAGQQQAVAAVVAASISTRTIRQG